MGRSQTKINPETKLEFVCLGVFVDFICFELVFFFLCRVIFNPHKFLNPKFCQRDGGGGMRTDTSTATKRQNCPREVVAGMELNTDPAWTSEVHLRAFFPIVR